MVDSQQRNKVYQRFNSNKQLGLTRVDNVQELTEYFQATQGEVEALLNPRVKYIVPKIV